MREIGVQTERKTQLVDITSDVQAALGEADGASAALIFVPHTTAGVTINEHGEENAPSHIRAALMSPQVLVPLRDGRLALGTWQGIFFCEFDGPRRRTVFVTTLR